MHDFSVFRTVHGPYDVPLDDPKPRFGQQRRKNRPRPCCLSPPHSFMVPPSILRGFPAVVQSVPMSRAGAGCGRRRRCRAPCLGRARTRARPCAPPRRVLLLHSSYRAATYPSRSGAATDARRVGMSRFNACSPLGRDTAVTFRDPPPGPAPRPPPRAQFTIKIVLRTYLCLAQVLLICTRTSDTHRVWVCARFP
jgi:hypothetical protein